MSEQPIPIGNARGRKAGGVDAPAYDPNRNLYQRISAITAAVGPVEATSKTASTAGGKKAIGIDDVEEVLGPLLAAHGIVTEWTSTAAPERISLPAREGTFDVWMVRLKVRLVNADDPADRTDWAEWADIGSNPIAGSSFARKAFYKALFHLAAAEDEGKPAARDQGHAPRSAPSAPAAGPPRKVLIEPGCPDCGGTLAILYRDGKNPFVGHAEWKPGADKCGWKPDFPTQAQWIRDAEATGAAASMMGQPMEDDAPPSGTVTLVEFVATAIERGKAYKRLDAASCDKLLRDKGWSGEGSAAEWIGSIADAGTLITLISALNEAIRDCPKEIPV